MQHSLGSGGMLPWVKLAVLLFKTYLRTATNKINALVLRRSLRRSISLQRDNMAIGAFNMFVNTVVLTIVLEQSITFSAMLQNIQWTSLRQRLSKSVSR